jgi:hypothetical protein
LPTKNSNGRIAISDRPAAHLFAIKPLHERYPAIDICIAPLFLWRPRFFSGEVPQKLSCPVASATCYGDWSLPGVLRYHAFAGGRDLQLEIVRCGTLTSRCITVYGAGASKKVASSSALMWHSSFLAHKGIFIIPLP